MRNDAKVMTTAVMASIFALTLISCQKIVVEKIVEKEILNEVHDTTYVEVHDTTFIRINDTIYVPVPDPDMYDWEQGRSTLPAISDMVLCYGGNQIRKSTDWPQSRFSEYVSYTDSENNEQWLFDSFLALDWRWIDEEVYDPGYDSDDPLDVPGKYALTAGHDYRSAPKEGWQYFLDFWFTDQDNGFNGLDKAVEAASAKLGKPSVPRRIVMFLPDPLRNEFYNDRNSSTTYWGEVDGQTLDFSKDEDRVKAYIWYVNEARSKFNDMRAKGLYQNIELIGFYILSEDLKHPSESWTDYAELYNCIPPLAEYLHSVNEYLYWIPYSSAPGRDRGWDLGIDYIWLQPNYFEHGSGYLTTAMSNIIREGLGMEIEFDRKAFCRFSSTYENWETYRKRFREYMSSAKSAGVYGQKPFTYYIMTDMSQDVMYQLRTSSYGKDKELYQEFCAFVAGNPLKEKLK